ncbi:hypothetical protein D3C71_1453040 [compost metagenome]
MFTKGTFVTTDSLFSNCAKYRVSRCLRIRQDCIGVTTQCCIHINFTNRFRECSLLLYGIVGHVLTKRGVVGFCKRYNICLNCMNCWGTTGFHNRTLNTSKLEHEVNGFTIWIAIAILVWIVSSNIVPKTRSIIVRRIITSSRFELLFEIALILLCIVVTVNAHGF